MTQDKLRDGWKKLSCKEKYEVIVLILHEPIVLITIIIMSLLIIIWNTGGFICPHLGAISYTCNLFGMPLNTWD